MKSIYNFRNIDHDKSLEKYADEKLGETLEGFHLDPMKIEITFSQVKLEKNAHLHLVAQNGAIFEFTHACDDFFHCIDKLHASLKRQLRKKKEKRVSVQVKNYKKVHNEVPDSTEEECHA